MISVVCPTNRIGGLDVLFRSLDAQTYQSWELILVDAIKPARETLYGPPHMGNRWPRDYLVNHIEPRGNPFPLISYCRSMNTGITHARGETLLYICDYSWLHPDCLATHAELQAKHRGPVTLDYDYRDMPKLKAGVPSYRETASGVDPQYTDQVNANTDRYVAELESGKLDQFMWSIFEEPLTEEAVNALPVEHRHRPSGADLANDWNWCSFKNESFPTELVLDMNGHDEEYDRSHAWQDSEFSYRLRERGIRWHAGPAETGMISVINPRPLMNIKRLAEPFGYNRELCFGSRSADKRLPVNPGFSLREVRREMLSLPV